MADYGHELLFGTFITPDAGQADRVVALARLTEQVGLDLVTVQDHPYQARFLDTWTLLSVIAAATSTVRVSPNVANLPLRPPAVLARSVATLDILSGGRVELGLGAGAFWDGVAAMGGRRLTSAQAVDALEEAIEIIRAIWSPDGGTVRVDGAHYRVWGAHPGPAPAHDVGIWVGSYKKRMLALTGRLADGWLPSSPYAGPGELPAMNAMIDEAALEAGRQPSDVRRLYNVSGTFDGRGTGFLDGPAHVWAEQLAELTLTQGMSGYILIGDDPDVIRRFAAEVAPAVQELVATERAGRTDPPPSDDPRPGSAADDREQAVVSATSPDASSPKATSAATASPATASSTSSSSAIRVRPAVPTSALAVVPTPDDGTRLSDVRVWDETTRPTGPAPDPNRRYTAHEQAAGRHLIDVHDHLREELRTLRGLVEQVAAGTMDPGTARSQINEMTMRQNNWTLGVYCQQYCRVVTTHHTMEDVGVFPHLRHAMPELAPVVDRLEREHHVIHDVLEGVDRALVALVTEPDGLKSLQAAVDLLTDALLSHLSYEERELVEPLARLGFS
ncbi:LLM class flavin-dependent oxidoreductase [Sphaerisporangium album]|uniref:LLM class flavin-dependent oxidoreductase n=1 Tax=Sphaerisporangium album TaxID=509200 RepID=A0A367FRK1_9ACTN|nr:LLM class flavin-dependent oxidoreductase [Sphaerisporangium album]RCG32337.1 LLM class flavin-dependent oxidoreductase [Sphaerisporangium album]